MHRKSLQRKSLYTLLFTIAFAGQAHAQLLGGGSVGGQLGGGLTGTVDRIGGATAGGRFAGDIGVAGSSSRDGFGRLDALRERTSERAALRAERLRQRAEDTTDATRERVAGTAQTTRDRLEQATTATTERAQSLQGRGESLAMRAGATASSTASRLHDRVDAVRPDPTSSASPIDADVEGEAQAEGRASASRDGAAFDGRASAGARASAKRNQGGNATATP